MRRFAMGMILAAATGWSSAQALGDDVAVAKSIAKQLYDSGKFPPHAVGVRFEDGTCRLKGNLASEELIEAALSIAMQNPEVETVINEMSVSAAAQPDQPVQPVQPRDAVPMPAPQSQLQIQPPQRPLSSRMLSVLRDELGTLVELPAASAANQPATPAVKPAVKPAAKPADKPAVQPGLEDVKEDLRPLPLSRTLSHEYGPAADEPADEPAEDARPAAVQPAIPAQPTAAQVAVSPARPGPSDGDRARTLASLLSKTPGLESLRIGVMCQGPQVWLKGEVEHAAQASAALALAKQQPGVAQVHNLLSVKPAPAPAQQISHQVSRATVPAQAAGRIARSAALQPVEELGVPLTTDQAPPVPSYVIPTAGGMPPVTYDHPHLPKHAWPSYAAYPNYAGVTYPKQHSAMAWPYIGPFYPYPQVPLGWRKVTLQWDDGWWWLDFKDTHYKACW